MCSDCPIGCLRSSISGECIVPIFTQLVNQFVNLSLKHHFSNKIRFNIKVFTGLEQGHTLDHLDTATSNIAGCAGGVISACALSWVINICRKFYCARLLQNDQSENSRLADFIYWCMRCSVKVNSRLGINRKTEIQKLDMGKKLEGQHEELNDPSHPRDHIELQGEDEDLFLEITVGSQDINIWSILMPAVYQLVPGSVIARFWFHSIFPPAEEGTESTLKVPMVSQESVFSNLMGKSTQFSHAMLLSLSQHILMTDYIICAHFVNNKVISTSLALGLIFGFALVQSYSFCFGRLTEFCFKETDESIALRKQRQNMMEGMYTAGESPDDDPASCHDLSENDDKME